ncbi:conserved Plasmodium protein, unknown function [Plasmodium vivax]|uniref:Uncharacterized protein n=2 Tax=Plasmodium vivax TaxID=5855 RepID=A0A1G4HFT0_PLAVI|nr:hypothetical protein PVNG_05688 [Plasmodium vivax North Korean]SCO73777.1 conserved Plasmodium protein, unknown function [Plasmodium vivax]
MKNALCLFYLWNLPLDGGDRRQTLYRAKVRRAGRGQENKVHHAGENYGYLDEGRNSEYEEILNEIICEYEEEERKKKANAADGRVSGQAGGQAGGQVGSQLGSQLGLGERQPGDHDLESNHELIPSTHQKGEDTCRSPPESTPQEEIKRIEKLKKNNFLNLCNINYDVLNLLLKEDLKGEEQNGDEHYNRVSLFLEREAGRSGDEAGDGYVDDGRPDDRYAGEGHVDDGHTDDRYVDDGHTDDRYVDDGHTDDRYVDDDLYIDDSLGRYLIRLDANFVNSISAKEFHVLRNSMYKHIIHLKYRYLRNYKEAIQALKQKKETRAEHINKHVSVVYEEGEDDRASSQDGDSRSDDHGDNGSDHPIDESTRKSAQINAPIQANNPRKDNTARVSFLQPSSEDPESLEQIDTELSVENIKEIIDVNQRLSKLQTNFKDLKNFNVFNLLDRNSFLNSLRVNNFSFYNYDCPLLFKAMRAFVRRIRQGRVTRPSPDEGTNVCLQQRCDRPGVANREHEQTFAEERCAYVSVPKLSDRGFLKYQDKSIVINLSAKGDQERDHLPPVKELNIDTDKGILILSANDKQLNVHVRNICDKISYLTQSLSIWPQLNYGSEEAFPKSVQIVKRMLMLMLFYFDIKNLFVICLDDASAKFFYQFLNREEDNLFKNLHTGKKSEQEEYLYVNLSDVKFSHIFNRKFVPLYDMKKIFKNYVFLMKKEEKFYDISSFKRSCLFMFLDEHTDKRNHVISSNAQHFFYYKKFDYPFIYSVDSKYSLNTLRSFNEILLYLTSWIDIFHTGESEASGVGEDDQGAQGDGEDGAPSPDVEESDKDAEKEQEEEEFIQNMQNQQQEDEENEDEDAYQKDERECDGAYGSDGYDDEGRDQSVGE